MLIFNQVVVQLYVTQAKGVTDVMLRLYFLILII